MKKRTVVQIKKLKKRDKFYHFRISKHWIEDYLGFKEGEIAELTLEKPKDVTFPKDILKAFKKHFKPLEKFSFRKLNKFFSLVRVEKVMYEDLNKKDIQKVIKKFENKTKKEYGNKFLQDYKLFKNTIFNLTELQKLAKKVKNKEFQEDYKISKKIYKSLILKNQ